MIGALLPLLFAGATGLAAGSIAKHKKEGERDAAAREKENDLLVKRSEKLAESGDWETYNALIPHLQKIGASENIIAAGSAMAQSRAKQIYTQELSSGVEPSIKPPPNYLSALMGGMSPQQGQAPVEPAQQQAAGGYLAHATSPEVSSQREATGLEPIPPEVNDFRARAFIAPQPAAAPSPTDAPQGIVFPTMKPSGSTTIHTPTGTRTVQQTGVLDKDSVASVYSQARQQQMPPNKVRAAIDIENMRLQAQGKPALDENLVNQAEKAYSEQHFEDVVNRIRPNLEAQGTDPGTAMQQAARKAYDETGILPEKWKSLIEPKEGQMAANAYLHAVERAKDTLPQILEMAKSAKSLPSIKNALSPGFLSRAIDKTPNLSGPDSTRAKEELAGTFAQRLQPQLQAQFPHLNPAQIAAKAQQLAAYGTDGVVPKEWYGAVMNDPTAFGFSKDQAEVMSVVGIDPFSPTAGRDAQDAKSQMELHKEFRQAALSKAQTPEGLAAAYQNLQKPGTAQPGAVDRQVQLQQKAATEHQTKTIEREHAVAPPGEMDKIKPLDDLYTTGIRIQQLVTQPDPQGKTLIDKYGTTPGTFVEWYRKASGALGETDPQLRKYTALLGKIFNVEKKTFAGVAVNLNERKDLLQFMPDPQDNVRTGMEKLNTLIQSAGGELERDLGLLGQNYPATKLDAFNYNKIKQAREAQKKKSTETK